MPRRNRKGRGRQNERAIKWTLWRQMTRNLVGSQAGYICHYCGRKTLRNVPDSHPLAFTVDHLTPRSRGGGWKRENLVCCCRECNNSKGDMTAEEFTSKASRCLPESI